MLVLRYGKLPRSALRLAVEGIDYHDVVVQFTVSWDEITDVTGVAPTGKNPRPIVFKRGEREPLVIASATLYAPGGVALFWMIRHYWRHAEARSELTNGVAIERLKAASFAAE